MEKVALYELQDKPDSKEDRSRNDNHLQEEGYRHQRHDLVNEDRKQISAHHTGNRSTGANGWNG